LRWLPDPVQPDPDQPAANIAEVKLERAAPAVAEVLLKRGPHGAKRDVVPWNVGLGKQARFQRFDPRLKIQIEQLRAKHQIHLIDMRQVVERIQRPHFNARAGFFPGLAGRTFERGLAVFHEPGGQGPQAIPGFDCAATQEDLVFPFGDTAHDHFRILIVDRAASGADVTRQAVTVGYAQCHRTATFAAKIHVGSNRSIRPR